MARYFSGLPRVVNYPLYLPELQGNGNSLLKQLKISEAIAEYQRLANLGSDSARTLLAFLHLVGAIDDAVNLDAAAVLAQESSFSGMPYADYVLAWIRLRQGNQSALHLLGRAAIQGKFLPAQLDLGRWAEHGTAFVGPNIRAAEDAYWIAHRRGHKSALLFVASLYSRGRCGLLKRLFGFILYPFALSRFVWQMLRDPYALEIFSFFPKRVLPFFVTVNTHGG